MPEIKQSPTPDFSYASPKAVAATTPTKYPNTTLSSAKYVGASQQPLIPALPFSPQISTQTLVKPQTTGQKAVNAVMQGGATVQKALQKIPLLGKLFK